MDKNNGFKSVYDFLAEGDMMSFPFRHGDDNRLYIVTVQDVANFVDGNFKGYKVVLIVFDDDMDEINSAKLFDEPMDKQNLTFAQWKGLSSNIFNGLMN